jgi:hypothetical protein
MPQLEIRTTALLVALLAAGSAHAHGSDRPAPYFGDREYPDPYIWDGWVGDGGYRGRAYYVATSPYVTRKHWPFYIAYEHQWSVADDIESLSRGP